MSVKPEVTSFFDESTNAVCHIVKDPDSNACAVIDSILQFDLASGTLTTELADTLIKVIKRRNLSVEWVLETHVHADHLSAAPYILEKTSGKLGIGSGISEVQKVFGEVFNAGDNFKMDGSQFDTLFEDGAKFPIGNMEVTVMHTPGHTPACLTYCIGDAVFVGDTIFMPDFGTARADFPGGDARQLYRSIQKLLQLPDATRMFLCHDYKAPGREYFCWQTTVKDQRRNNIHIGDGKTEEEFVAFRSQRDRELNTPKLLIPSIQINMRAGRLPQTEENGTSYLKIPINRTELL